MTIKTAEEFFGIALGFDEDQPRDDHGRFASSGGGDSGGGDSGGGKSPDPGPMFSKQVDSSKFSDTDRRVVAAGVKNQDAKISGVRQKIDLGNVRKIHGKFYADAYDKDGAHITTVQRLYTGLWVGSADEQKTDGLVKNAEKRQRMRRDGRA